jgi:hypothetical protein
MNSPYLTVWFQTSRTIDKIVSGKVKFIYYIPLLLATFSATVFQPIRSEWMIFTFFAMVPLYYFAIAFIYPRMILMMGLIWQGKSDVRKINLIMGLAQIPVIPILVYQILVVTVNNTYHVNPLLQLMVTIFAVRILIISVAKVQGFKSYGLAVLNIFFVFLPFIILYLLVYQS